MQLNKLLLRCHGDRIFCSEREPEEIGRWFDSLSLGRGVSFLERVKLDQAIGGFGMREERDAIEPGLTGNVGDLPASGALVELDRAD